MSATGVGVGEHLLLQDKLSVTWQAVPFSSRHVHRMALPQGLSCAEIVAQVPDLDTRAFLEMGTFCVNGEVVPREMWHLVRPKSRNDVIVTMHMPIRGGGGGGGKDVLRIVAAIALVVVASAITGGAAAGLFGTGTLAAGSLGAQILAGAITVGGALLLGAFVKPPSAKPEEAQSQEEGGTASLQGNTLKRGAGIPRVVGTHRVYPPFLSQPLIDVNGYDEVVEGVYGLAGPHQLRNIKFGDTFADEIDADQLSYQFYELIPGEGGIDDDVQIMLHFNGEQDSIKFVDSSSSTRDFTLNGSVFLDKAARWLGFTAAYFGGSSSFLSTATTPDFTLGDNDWQVDGFFEWDTSPTVEGRICGHSDASLTAAGSSFYVYKDTSGKLNLWLSDGSTGTTVLTSSSVVNTGRHHFIAARIGNTIGLWVDGILEDTAAFTGTVPACGEVFGVGNRGVNSVINNWQGWIDEFRFTVGKAWVSEFANVQVPQVEHKPADPDLVTRYGKSGAPNILLSKHRISNDEATQGTRDKLSNQSVPQLSLPQSQSVTIRGRQLDEVWVTLGFQGLFYTEDDPDFEQDWFFGIPFRVRVRALGSAEWVQCPEFHIHERRTASFPRLIVFRWDSDTTMPSGVPNEVPPERKGWKAAYSSVPVQNVAPVGIGGWTADDHFYAGSGDTYMTADNFDTTGLRNMRMSTERVEFFLDGLVDKGSIEVEIRRGQLYVADEFTYSTYNLSTDPPADNLSDGIYDLFGYATLNATDEVVILKQSNASDQVVIARTSAVWNEAPVARKGEFAAIYVQATGRSLDALSVEASGLVPDWDGEEWTGLNVTSNPAPHYRDVLTGRLNDNRIPESMVNDETLLEWRQRCLDLNFQCNAVFSSEQVDRVLEVIASCGYARPRQAELWDVAQDRDFSNTAPVQMFNPRNMRGFRWEKAFLRHRPDGLRVRFNDADDDYVERTLVVPRLGVIAPAAGRLEEIRYDGIVYEIDAVFKAVYDQQQVIDRFTFYYGEVDAEILVCRRGDLVLVQHDTMSSVAGFSRVLDVSGTDGDVASITLDGSVSPIDSFFESSPVFFEEPTDFFTNDVGVAIRLKDGTVIMFNAEVSEDGFTLTPTAELGNYNTDMLERECLVSTGRLLRSTRRMLVYDIRPRGDLSAEVTFVDEAPDLWQFPEPVQVEEAFMRNRIINGDMRLDQREEGAVHTIVDETDTYTLDRWCAYNRDSAGSTSRFSIQQLTTDPPPGFTHYLRAEVISPTSPLPDEDYYAFFYTFAESDLQEIDWGTSNGKQMSLSFNVRVSEVGTYTGRVLLEPSGLAYIFTMSIPVADTWVRRVITIPAPPTSPPLFDGRTGRAGRIEWSLGLGDDFLTVSEVNQWIVSSTLAGVDGQINLVETNGATFDITGVQFEVGAATQFEWLPLSFVKQLAYPYFQAFRQEMGQTTLGTGYAVSTTQARIAMPLFAPMRAVPRVSIPDDTMFRLLHAATATASTDVAVASPDESSLNVLNLLVSVAAGLTAGQGVAFGTDDTAAELFAEAELF